MPDQRTVVKEAARQLRLAVVALKRDDPKTYSTVDDGVFIAARSKSATVESLLRAIELAIREAE